MCHVRWIFQLKRSRSSLFFPFFYFRGMKCLYSQFSPAYFVSIIFQSTFTHCTHTPLTQTHTKMLKHWTLNNWTPYEHVPRSFPSSQILEYRRLPPFLFIVRVCALTCVYTEFNIILCLYCTYIVKPFAPVPQTEIPFQTHFQWKTHFSPNRFVQFFCFSYIMHTYTYTIYSSQLWFPIKNNSDCVEMKE